MGFLKAGKIRRSAAVFTAVALLGGLGSIVTTATTPARAYVNKPGVFHPSWNGVGEVEYDSSGANAEGVFGLGIDTHRRTIVGTHDSFSAGTIVISRLNSDGSTDDSFGQDGFTALDVATLLGHPSG